MAMQISTYGAHKAIKIAEAAQNRLRHLREKGEEITESVVRTLVTTGTGFTLGVVQGANVFANGEIPFVKVPLELGVGIAAHAVRLLGWAGKHSGGLADVGDGALTSYFHVLGRGVGAQHWGKSATRGEMSGSLADRLAAIAA